jgi:hypothetical protein
MKRIITIITAVVLFGAGISAAEAQQQESAAMRTLRHQADAVRVSTIRQHASENRTTVEKAEFMIRRIMHRQAFLDANPQWVAFGKGPGMQGRQGEGNRPRMRQRSMDTDCDNCDKTERKNMRHESRGSRTESAPVERETAEMKAVRHARLAAHIARMQAAVADGKVPADRGAFMVASIQSRSAFQDANPEWTQYMPAGRPGAMQRGRMGRGRNSGEGQCGAGNRGNTNRPRGR